MNLNVSDILTPELTTLIATTLITVIGALLTDAVRRLPGLIKSKTTAEQFDFLQSVATVAVQAAEQMHVAGYIMDKKGVAIGIVVRELAAKGIKVDQTAIDTAVEAAVMDAFNQFKAKDPQPETAVVSADIVAPRFDFASPTQSDA